ncbi:MAG: amidohydrolase family protein, partial [Tepidisphaeraceae bacterium]
GRIVAVGDAKTLARAHGDAELTDLGPSVILPGLVNAHTHLELSGCNAGDWPGGSFGDWILSLPRRIGRQSDRPAEEIFAKAVNKGIKQCVRFGATAIGDISQQMQVSRTILRDAPIRSVSFGEVIGLAGNRTRYLELLPRAIDRSLENNRMRIGLTPHAPYTVDLPGYRECLDLGRSHRLPLATHLAETPAEREFLENHQGEFRQIWETLGHWQDGVETFRGSPVRFAHAIGLLDYESTLLAHVNYCDDEELEILARGQASVVYCPRTHRYFGHPPHRWREMLDRGINVVVGTDSCASSPDLNLVDDLRLMHEIGPDFPVDQLWRMATLRAATALGWETEIGSLEPGKSADFVAFEVDSDQPLTEILESYRLPAAVWAAGRRLT